MESPPNLEERIGEWRSYMLGRQAVHQADIEELEDHLRTQMKALGECGLDEDEAFLVSVKRLGDLDSLSREFAREYSERLWKQLVLPMGQGEASADGTWEARLAVGLAIAAAVAIKVPELFGVSVDESYGFYLRNFSLFVMPFLAGYFAWKRRLERMVCGWLALPFLAGGLIVSFYPFNPGGHTDVLVAIHLPIVLWLAMGIAYTGGKWRNHKQRMNFVRFSGEWFIYYTLIACGGGVLMAFALFIFGAIGLDAFPLVSEWVLPCGMVGAVLISAWLVEAKQNIIENMAPVLTRLFTPLFTVLLLVFLITMLWTKSVIRVEREVLIGFDLLLVLVLGLLLYSISARDAKAPPDAFDGLQLLLVVSALFVDAFALWAIVARISEFGFTPNRTAALAENLILLVNLGWSAVLYTRFVAKRGPFSSLERWQTTYGPVYAVWAWIVVAVFPILFHYR